VDNVRTVIEGRIDELSKEKKVSGAQLYADLRGRGGGLTERSLQHASPKRPSSISL